MATSTTYCMSRTVKILKTCIIPSVGGLRNAYACPFRGNPGYQCRCMSNNGSDTEGEDDLIEKLRDVSRVPAHISCKMDHRAKAPSIDTRFHYMTTKDFKRRLYAKYGKESGINPGLMWPSREELTEIKEVEAEWETSLDEMKRILNEQKEQEAEQRMKKLEHVEKQMARMPKYMEEFKARSDKLKAIEKLQADKQRDMIEEARDYYGYYVDSRSDKFKELVSIKQEERKKQRKLEKKQEKESLLARGIIK